MNSVSETQSNKLLRGRKIIEKFIYEDNNLKDFSFYDDEDYLFYVFSEKIAKISGDGELLPHHEFYINYKEKFCIFNDFEIDHNTNKKIYTTTYKITLIPSLKQVCSLINIFILKKIYQIDLSC